MTRGPRGILLQTPMVVEIDPAKRVPMRFEIRNFAPGVGSYALGVPDYSFDPAHAAEELIPRVMIIWLCVPIASLPRECRQCPFAELWIVWKDGSAHLLGLFADAIVGPYTLEFGPVLLVEIVSNLSHLPLRSGSGE